MRGLWGVRSYFSCRVRWGYNNTKITWSSLFLQPNRHWEVDLQSLENQIDEKTAAIVVNNPSNPCGSVYTKEHLEDIIDIASRNRVPIIADEIYEHIVFSNQEFIALSSLSKDVPVLTCSGVTKRFLIPGWRLGWVIIHDRHNILGKEFRNGLMRMSARILGPSTLIQKALPRIFKETPQIFFDETIQFIEVRLYTYFTWFTYSMFYFYKLALLGNANLASFPFLSCISHVNN